jgi:hypothetical protein
MKKWKQLTNGVGIGQLDFKNPIATNFLAYNFYLLVETIFQSLSLLERFLGLEY